MDTLTFTIESIRYHNKDNGYTVIEAKNEKTLKTFTAVGTNMLDPAIGMKISATGDWTKNDYGKQFKFTDYTEEDFNSNQGLINYLGGGFFKGIGPAIAKKIVDYFGDETVNVIENEPERLSEVKRVSNKIIDSLTVKWKEHKCVFDIMLFFKEYNFSNSLILKIYRKYDRDAVSIIKNNPYVMVEDIDGIGFKKADDIALNMGFDKCDEKRIYAGIKYVLTLATEDGHTFLYYDTLLDETRKILGVNDSITINVLTDLINDGEIIKIDEKIFLTQFYRAEKNVAEKILAINDFKPYKTENLPKTIEDIEKENGVKFNELQRKAINLSLESNIMILTGGPGTGKTTALLGIIQILKSLGMHIGAAAPTGKAAKRMTEVTGLNAKTIHRLLIYNPYSGYNYNDDNPLPYDVIIIDEISMVNILLMNSLLEAITPGTKLILVGDADQLPAIGPGNVLADCIESKIIPTVCLTEIFRQAEDSEIILNAHAINNGKPIKVSNKKPNNNFFFITKSDMDSISDEIMSLVTTRLPNKYGVQPTDIQVLTPMRKYTPVGSDELNHKLQKAINPSEGGITFGKTTFKVGDKVMQLKNNYLKEVFNGDTGYITDIDTEERTIKVEYDDQTVEYDSSEFDEITLAYATTIHKSQGSEYSIVIIPITEAHHRMLQRNLIYTAVTRSKDVCILIGSPEMFKYAVNNTQYSVRNTYLKDLLLR